MDIEELFKAAYEERFQESEFIKVIARVSFRTKGNGMVLESSRFEGEPFPIEISVNNTYYSLKGVNYIPGGLFGELHDTLTLKLNGYEIPLEFPLRNRFRLSKYSDIYIYYIPDELSDSLTNSSVPIIGFMIERKKKYKKIGKIRFNKQEEGGLVAGQRIKTPIYTYQDSLLILTKDYLCNYEQ